MSLLSRLAVQAARAYGMLVAGSANNVSADYLVVAGGGGGGAASGGGGGAGGFLTSTATLSTLNTYSITVGAGGALGSYSGTRAGSSGNNSVISGTGLTTITSIGGGGAQAGSGNTSPAAQSGGSGGGGGGGSSSNTGGAGTSGQGNAGGDAGGYGGAGGGGASAAGANTSSGIIRNGGAGGNGSSSSISGSSVTYAGGGGGGPESAGGGTGGAGGTGGGGTGNSSGGTANTGGGGGGGNNVTSPFAGYSGGSGIVIISYTSATPKFVGGTITTSGGKQIHTFTSSGTLSPITPITASYLVVAGGGGAGRTVSGGGGGGGYLTSSTTLYSGATYIVTVGGGGAVGATLGARGTNGGNSVISGTGLTTITSLGGGGGGADGTGTVAERSGNSGGSGGGAVNTNGVPGAGTSGQGNAGGNGSTNCAGGGGGAGAVGGNGSGNIGGTGGNGLQSSISGTATYYAGGGGGGGYNTASTNAGGLGGGGNGTNDATNSTPGTPNSGGGGGGAGFTGAPAGTSASGGSGIVIISYAGSQVFNGGLVTTSGGNTIHTFTSTGALTPLTNNLNNSLRFRSSASAYLSRTPTVAGNQQKWTWSGWVKLGAAVGTAGYTIFSGGTSTPGTQGGNRIACWVNTSNQLQIDIGGIGPNITTSAVFRDPSAWYHVVFNIDTTQATAGNRSAIYVNGVQQAVTTTVTITQNVSYGVNATQIQTIGTFSNALGGYNWDGYIADVNFVDGQQLEPYYFGNNDANGVWKPIQYKGTYGTNGFYLTFGNTTSTTTIGYDTSGNNNNFTSSGISLTAGTTYDAMTDVPTNTSATISNYATLNPNLRQTGTGQAPTSGNLKLTANTTGYSQVCCATIASTSGKFYWEVTLNNVYGGFGIADSNNSSFTSVVCTTSSVTANPSQYTWGWNIDINSGNKQNNNVTTSYGSGASSGDVYMCAVDIDNGKVWWGKNGTWFASGNPASGTNAAFTNVSGNIIPYFSPTDAGGSTQDVNFGQRPFAYTPPTGFVALNTYNLPTPTILQGNKYMDATLYTGNGAGQTIVNQGQFYPDLIWVKSRSNATNNNLFTSVLSGANILKSNSTDGVVGVTNAVTAFNSNGFTLGSDSGSIGVNINSNTYVAWQWLAGATTGTTTNTNGSITSYINVNTTAGFSQVYWTGTAANGTLGHGLGVAPKFIITKCRGGSTDWAVWHTSIANTQYLVLNSTAAVATGATYWNSTSPTSSVFSVGSSNPTNAATAMVAYCWAEIAGFSKFGKYSGNGSADGPFVYLGFRPKYVMIKNITTSGYGGWVILDTSRNTYNVTNLGLAAESSGAEFTVAYGDLLSNGIKFKIVDNGVNASGQEYIYMAFAENPFKNANAR